MYFQTVPNVKQYRYKGTFKPYQMSSNVLTKDGNNEGKGLAGTSFGRAQDVQTTQCQALGEKKKIVRSTIRVSPRADLRNINS